MEAVSITSELKCDGLARNGLPVCRTYTLLLELSLSARLGESATSCRARGPHLGQKVLVAITVKDQYRLIAGCPGVNRTGDWENS